MAIQDIMTSKRKIYGSTFLVLCRYEYYCQGYEEAWGYFLVEADTFDIACSKLKKQLQNARDFKNHTIS